MADNYLDKAYELETVDETRRLYDAWADSYDEELARNEYATPGRIAEALAGFADPSRPVLDFGCGTGLSGVALARAGFGTIDGADLSADMLAEARAKGIYRDLAQIEPDSPFRATPGDYGAIVACGVIGVGAAPLSVFDDLMAALAPGGYLAFSFNDHALDDPAFEAKVSEYTDCAAARLLLREYGPHLPGIGLKSMVYVMEKT